MKSISKLSFVLLFTFSFITLFATNPISPEAHGLNGISVDDYLGMKYKDYKDLSLEKSNFSDRIGFLVTKRYFKSQIRKGAINKDADYNTAAGGFKFKIGPFIVGGILGLLGLLLVVILVKKPRKNAVISCVLGMLLWGTLIGLLRI